MGKLQKIQQHILLSVIRADRSYDRTKNLGRFPEVPSDAGGATFAVAMTTQPLSGGAPCGRYETAAEQASDRVLASSSSGDCFSDHRIGGGPAGFAFKSALFFLILFATLSTAHAQQRKQERYLVSSEQISRPDTPYLPKAAVKTNLLYLATTTLNASFEFGLGRRWTLDLAGAYNPFQLKKESTNQVWFAQPEFRYWLCNRFERHFFGFHGIYGGYNIGQVDYLTTTFLTHRYKGVGYGAGISWGYHAVLGGRWAMEFSLGAGYLFLDYDKFRCFECDELAGTERKHYFGPTKAAISMIFMIK